MVHTPEMVSLPVSEAEPILDQEDPLRSRLGWLGDKLPATNRPLRPQYALQIARRLSVTKTLYWSWRFRGRILVARGSRISAQRTSRIECRPNGWLLVGFHQSGPNGALVDLGRDATLVLNGTFQVWRGAQVMVFAGGTLEMGDKCIFNEDSRLVCFKSIRFGDGSGMSWNALVMDSDLHPIKTKGVWAEKDKAVVIGDHSFVGTGAMVLKGVTVGDGVIIAAGAVVTRDVASRTAVAGNPARVVSEDVDWI